MVQWLTQKKSFKMGLVKNILSLCSALDFVPKNILTLQNF